MENKRRHPRFVVEGVDGHMVLASRVELVNISLGGVALIADRRLNLGASYALRLERSEHAVDLHGTVVWSTLSGLRHLETGESVPEYSAGLRFSGLMTPELQALLEFIDANRILTEQRLAGLRFIIEAPDLALLRSPEAFVVRLVSRCGMLIESEQPFELDQLFPLEIRLPYGDLVRGQGRIASVFEPASGPAGRYELGIEFVELAGDGASVLDSFISTLSDAAPS